MDKMDYEGHNRRQVQQFEVLPSQSWWGKVVLPILVGLLTQLGVAIWWASGMEHRATFLDGAITECQDRYETLNALVFEHIINDHDN